RAAVRRGVARRSEESAAWSCGGGRAALRRGRRTALRRGRRTALRRGHRTALRRGHRTPGVPSRVAGLLRECPPASACGGGLLLDFAAKACHPRRDPASDPAPGFAWLRIDAGTRTQE